MISNKLTIKTQDNKKRLATFLILTFSISAIPNYIITSNGTITTVAGLLAMWSPGITAILTQLLFRNSLRDFGWGWGKTRYQVWSVAVPFLYVLVIHLLVWGTGLGGFTTTPIITTGINKFGIIYLMQSVSMIE